MLLDRLEGKFGQTWLFEGFEQMWALRVKNIVLIFFWSGEIEVSKTPSQDRDLVERSIYAAQRIVDGYLLDVRKAS